MLVGLVERHRRPVEVAHPAADLADGGLGEAERVEETEPLELLARLAGLLLGLRPLAVEHLELSPMDPADSRVAGGPVPEHPRTLIEPFLTGPGEIADFEFTPAAAGDLTLALDSPFAVWHLNVPVEVRSR